MTSTKRANSLTIQEIESLRATLIRVREENVADLNTATSKIDTLLAEGSASDPSLREDVANAKYMTQDASSIIAMVEGTLLRIEDGTYGTCTQCQQDIPLARLQLRPYLPMCIACSS